MMNRAGFWGCVIFCCLPMACSSGSANPGPVAAEADGRPNAATRPAQTPAAPAKADKQESQVTARIMNWDEAQKLAAGRKGRVVVVDVWSTDCVPCRKEFPHLVALQKEHGENVACISINVDFIGLEVEPSAELQEGVLRFLREQDAAIENVICSDPADEIYDRVDFVSIPAVYVYDRSGELKRLFKNDAGDYGKDGFTYAAHVSPLVRELIGSGAAASASTAAE
jgi:thiol-disulfide isomerase/thioredoxin